MSVWKTEALLLGNARKTVDDAGVGPAKWINTSDLQSASFGLLDNRPYYFTTYSKQYRFGGVPVPVSSIVDELRLFLLSTQIVRLLYLTPLFRFASNTVSGGSESWYRFTCIRLRS